MPRNPNSCPPFFMSVKPCPKCGKLISKYSDKCHFCKAPVEWPKEEELGKAPNNPSDEIKAFLKPCEVCGKDISTKAAACPHCGHPVKPVIREPAVSSQSPAKKEKKKSSGCAIVLLSLIIGFGVLIAISGNVNQEEKDPRQIRIERGFSAWDGPHLRLTRMVKAQLRDPKSFEHIETKFSDEGDHLLVYMSYRARNGFGGMTTGRAIAKCSLDGSVIEVISNE